MTLYDSGFAIHNVPDFSEMTIEDMHVWMRALAARNVQTRLETIVSADAKYIVTISGDARYSGSAGAFSARAEARSDVSSLDAFRVALRDYANAVHNRLVGQQKSISDDIKEYNRLFPK